jgi:hypothetical protein
MKALAEVTKDALELPSVQRQAGVNSNEPLREKSTPFS